MRKLIHLSLAVTAFSVILGTSSCKKDKNDPVCRISTASNTSTAGTSLMTFTYTGDGKIASITSTGTTNSSKTFTHTSNTINIVDRNSAGAVTNSYDVTLNNEGKVTSMLTKDAAGAIITTATITYDASGNLNRYITSGPSGTDTSNAIFSEGNLTSVVNGANVSIYTYYTDKTFMDGDYLKFVQLLNTGALYVVNRNMLKSFTNAGVTTNIVYEYDNSGKITRMTATSPTYSESVNYTYNCN